MTEKWTEKDLTSFLKEKKIVAVECYTDQCPFCKTFGMIWERVAALPQTAAVCFGRINLEEEGSVQIQYHIQSVPTVLLFQNGICVQQLVGAVDQKRLLNAILQTTEGQV